MEMLVAGQPGDVVGELDAHAWRKEFSAAYAATSGRSCQAGSWSAPLTMTQPPASAVNSRLSSVAMPWRRVLIGSTRVTVNVLAAIDCATSKVWSFTAALESALSR